MFSRGEVVTILRDAPGGFDAYGDPVTSTTTRIPVTGCAVAPRYSTEPTVRGHVGVIIGLSWYIPAGVSVLYTDRAEIAGVVYLIEGEPGAWVNPFTGHDFGFEVALKRAVGV